MGSQAPLLLTSGGYYWKPVQTCSLEGLPNPQVLTPSGSNRNTYDVKWSVCILLACFPVHWSFHTDSWSGTRNWAHFTYYTMYLHRNWERYKNGLLINSKLSPVTSPRLGPPSHWSSVWIRIHLHVPPTSLFLWAAPLIFSTEALHWWIKWVWNPFCLSKCPSPLTQCWTLTVTLAGKLFYKANKDKPESICLRLETCNVDTVCDPLWEWLWLTYNKQDILTIWISIFWR